MVGYGMFCLVGALLLFPTRLVEVLADLVADRLAVVLLVRVEARVLDRLADRLAVRLAVRLADQHPVQVPAVPVREAVPSKRRFLNE